MGENICKQCNRKWINLQILHTAHAGKKKKPTKQQQQKNTQITQSKIRQKTLINI